MPVSKWAGNCYSIAVMCVEKNVISGKPRYGHYRGPIHKDSMFARNITIGFCQHGWVELADGRIWDPTRWVFECVEPYIYVGKNDHYDVGGNVARKRFKMPAPAFDAGKKVLDLDLEDSMLSIVRMMLGDTRESKTFTVEQVAWVSTEDPASFGGGAQLLYEELARLKMDAFVPLDNWRLVMEG